MQPIADMEDDEFMKLQTLYASEFRSARFAHLRGCTAAAELDCFRSSEKGHVRRRESCAGRAVRSCRTGPRRSRRRDQRIERGREPPLPLVRGVERLTRCQGRRGCQRDMTSLRMLA
jgi:hypothetical protein